jgi:molecular chaperone GrpE
MSKSSKKKDNNEKIDASKSQVEEQIINDQDESTEENERDLEKEIQELNDKYLRLFSEFDNFRRRTAREKLDLMKSASADLLTELLPVADDFDRTLKSFDDAEDKSLVNLEEGVKLVQSKFISTLERQGLKVFESKEKKFDSDFHEAITKIPAPSKKLKGKIVDVIEKGYMLNDKVLRYAKVVVGE